MLRMLDLFCGAGGASAGYARAGFTVTGVDRWHQPRYPYEFIQGDAIAHLRSWEFVRQFTHIHASPPCQAHSDLRTTAAFPHGDYIPEVRALLQATGLPYVIENVEGAPLQSPITLCGTMFPPLRVLRHRLFESNCRLDAPTPHPPHPKVMPTTRRSKRFGTMDPNTSFITVTGGGNSTLANARDAMGIDWMNKAEINQAIPPAYTEYIGRQLRDG